MIPHSDFENPNWNRKFDYVPPKRPLSLEEVKKRLINLEGWTLSRDGATIRCDLAMEDFASAIGLIRAIAELAEAEDHHPDLHVTGYCKLGIELSTHDAGGLTDQDFMLAAQIDALPKRLKAPEA